MSCNFEIKLAASINILQGETITAFHVGRFCNGL